MRPDAFMPAVSILKVIEQKPIAEIDDQTLILADVAHKAMDQVERGPAGAAVSADGRSARPTADAWRGS